MLERDEEDRGRGREKRRERKREYDFDREKVGALDRKASRERVAQSEALHVARLQEGEIRDSASFAAASSPSCLLYLSPL